MTTHKASMAPHRTLTSSLFYLIIYVDDLVKFIKNMLSQFITEMEPRAVKRKKAF